MKEKKFIFHYEKVKNIETKSHSFKDEQENKMTNVYRIILQDKNRKAIYTSDNVMCEKVKFNLGELKNILRKNKAFSYKCKKNINIFGFKYGHWMQERIWSELYFANKKNAENAMEELNSYLVMQKLIE